MARPKKYKYDKLALIKAYKAGPKKLWAPLLAKKFKLPTSLVYAIVYNEVNKNKKKKLTKKKALKVKLFQLSVVYAGLNI